MQNQYNTMSFGMHKGKQLQQLPKAYLAWLCSTIQDNTLRSQYQIELNRRYTLYDTDQ